MQDFYVLIKQLTNFVKQLLRNYWPGIRRYLRKLFDHIVQLIVVTCAVFILEALVLFIAQGFWGLYSSTPVGERFTSQFPDSAAFLTAITREPALYFAFGAIKVTLKICSGLAVFCQFCYIARFFYYSRGIIGKSIWAAGVSVLTAHMFLKEWTPLYFSVAYAGVIIPVMFILPNCFKMATMVLPEIGDVFRRSYLIKACQLIKSAFLKFQR